MTDAPSVETSARSTLPAVSGVSAPHTTRIAAFVVMVGILVQASIAGGFLAGHALNDIHMIVGIPLVVSGIVLTATGLAGRRRNSEPASLIATRVGVLLALLLTAFAGILAGQGTRDLLIVHIPLAIISMGLAARLVSAAGQVIGTQHD